MSIKIRHCIVIYCDACGTEQEHEDYGTTHFENLDQAVTYLGSDVGDETNWLMSPTEHVCPDCRGKRACLSWWSTRAAAEKARDKHAEKHKPKEGAG